MTAFRYLDLRATVGQVTDQTFGSLGTFIVENSALQSTTTDEAATVLYHTLGPQLLSTSAQHMIET
jgi:hypothetical protein